MKGAHRRAAVAAAVLLFVGAALRATEYRVDLSRSRLEFRARSRFAGVTEGRFRVFDGRAEVPAEGVEKSTATFEIDVRSIDTGIKKRDRHLRTADFFDADTHPTAALRITRLEGAAPAFTARGTLTLRGVTKDLSFPVTVVTTPDGALRAAGGTTIRRKEFGIDYDSRLNPIRDEVHVLFDVTLKK